MEIEIRKAIESDEPKFIEITKLSWLSAYSHIFGEERILKKFENRLTDEEYHKEQLDEIKNTDKQFAVCVNSEVVGIMSIETESDFLEITRLYMHPNHQRLGLGKRCFEKASNIAKNKGLNKIKIEALKENHIGCAFYSKMGGKITSSRTKELCGINAELVTFEYNL